MADQGYIKQDDGHPTICERCGGRLKYLGGGEYKCQSCYRVQLDDYGKVREFLYDYGGSMDADMIAAYTGVSEEKLVEFMRDGKISASKMSPFTLSCERCGRAIASGHYCERCQQYFEDVEEYQKERIKEQDTPKVERKAVLVRNKSQDGRMRYYNNKDKRN